MELHQHDSLTQCLLKSAKVDWRFEWALGHGLEIATFVWQRYLYFLKILRTEVMTLPEIYLQAISDHELKNVFLLDPLTNTKYIILFFFTQKKIVQIKAHLL